MSPWRPAARRCSSAWAPSGACIDEAVELVPDALMLCERAVDGSPGVPVGVAYCRVADAGTVAEIGNPGIANYGRLAGNLYACVGPIAVSPTLQVCYLFVLPQLCRRAGWIAGLRCGRRVLCFIAAGHRASSAMLSVSVLLTPDLSQLLPACVDACAVARAEASAPRCWRTSKTPHAPRAPPLWSSRW